MTLLFLASIFQNLPSATLGVWSKPHANSARSRPSSTTSHARTGAHPSGATATPRARSSRAELMDENEGCASVPVIATAERAAMVVLTTLGAAERLAPSLRPRLGVPRHPMPAGINGRNPLTFSSPPRIATQLDSGTSRQAPRNSPSGSETTTRASSDRS